VITCGSFTVNGSGNATVSLGYEPQWVMVKASSNTSNWEMYDSMRGLTATSASARLYPNLSSAEGSASSTVNATSTGFTVGGNMGAGLGGVTYIYIAIRRGPMKVPTVGTTVFEDFTYSAGTAQTQNAGFNGDLLFIKQRGAGGDRSILIDRLRGYELLNAASTSAALTPSDFGLSNSNFPSYVGSNLSNYTSIPTGDAGWNGGGGNTYVDYAIAHAPGFFDIVTYTGNGSTQTLTHNLGAVPELIIFKSRSGAASWWTYSATLGYTQSLRVNVTDAAQTGETRFGSSTPTSTSFYVDAVSAGGTNSTSVTYVAFLFATCAGVSKVGSYTGTATTKQVDCGFTAGARFVLIKRTDSTGDWYVYDSARGIVSGNDPYLLLNSTAAEVTGTDYVDTYNAGFELSSTAPAGLNANGGTYIFLAIA